MTTPRQVQTLRYIDDYALANDRPPTTTEIATHLKVASTNAVQSKLKALQAQGLVNRAGDRTARGIRITEAGREFLKKKDEQATRPNDL